ncbi:APH domain-containing protein [Paraburkholderia tropica]|uniref:bifunctional aminoglycoside phosphotransferase/ATP-binding protein n=1 Tax=Paraburkholderia tropica TaxID=92647 RepID=UPI001CAEBD16|nr:bifunctional aminoglycoside phosphotransferase/ATP-binding protein [Paraburkholderia tropica]CAG9217741.1 APH domain-containing protein [Paraburkholderia tropica]
MPDTDTKPPAALHVQNRLRAARRHGRALDKALRRTRTYAHPGGHIVRIETHISVVYLAGRYAYKIMKPVNFGFVDFTTLDARRRCCEAEIRLNRPFAGAIYRDVQAIVRRARGVVLKRAARGVGDAFSVAGVFDYAVRMRRFDQRELFSRRLAAGVLAPADIDAAAAKLAACHREAPRVGGVRGAPGCATPYGSASLLGRQIFDALVPLERDARSAGFVRDAALRAWCEAALARLAPRLDARRIGGFVRACHGDLHLDNIVRCGRHALLFDCIEFSEALRWIDIASDLAFLVMDLRAHGRDDLANRLLARYLDATGDFGGLAALRLYVVYRALVRALVAQLKTPLATADDAAQTPTPGQRYLDLAAREVREANSTLSPRLLLCHGFSGSGKSVASRAFAALSGAIRISSDIERKRANVLDAPALGALPPQAYTREAIDAHYTRLVALASEVLDAGYTVLIDATFLQRANRQRFAELAQRSGVPMLILDFHADTARLVERVNARAAGPRDPSDAGEAVLATQLANAEALDDEERRMTVQLNTDVPIATFSDKAWWEPVWTRMDAAEDS